VHSVFEHSIILPNETCGIIAYVGKEEGEAWDVLVDGLTILENRGYDSAGVCTLDSAKNQLVISKFASSQQHSDAIAR
jgi:glucosamine--fructose-6-phosphate aminotransferase (isomerizing)